MFRFLFKATAFFVLSFVIGACMTLSGAAGTDDQNSDFVNFIPMAASFFIVFFLPSVFGKGGK